MPDIGDTAHVSRRFSAPREGITPGLRAHSPALGLSFLVRLGRENLNLDPVAAVVDPDDAKDHQED